jgi:hypothetical protein
MFDSDLALIYGISTKRLNEQVRRNRKRFLPDFGFARTPKEVRILRSQSATSSWGGRRYLPWVFTEHGALMLASVLSSSVALQASIQVVRAFVRLRELLGNPADLARRLDELEARYDGHFKTVSMRSGRSWMLPSSPEIATSDSPPGGRGDGMGPVYPEPFG